MSLEGRDLSDTQILDATKMEHDPEMGHRLSVLLPSGRTLYSDYGPAEELRKRLIVWCESVRSSIDADLQETKALEARKRLEAISVPERDVPSPLAGASQGAAMYAAQQLAFFEKEEARLVDAYGRIFRSLEEAKKEVTRWTAIAEALKE